MQPIIKLKIFGNPNRFDGFNHLITKGVISIDEKDADRSFPISDTPAICIYHKDDHIFYFLRESGGTILPCDSEGDGRLSIILAIPKDHVIKGNISPYEVLMDVYNSFIEKFTTVISGTDVKRFNQSLESILNRNDEFRTILDKYELEPATKGYVPMSPDSVPATLHVPKEKLNDFFCDTQYPEFRGYKEIYITTQDQSSEALVGLKIPREKEYEIWVNGKIHKKAPLLVTTPIQSNGDLDSEDKTHDPVSVTLQDLIEAEGNKLTFGHSTAELNLEKRRIILEIPSIPIYYKLEFKFNGDEDGIKKVKQNLETGQNKLTIAGIDVSKKVNNPDAKIVPSITKGETKFTGAIEGYIVTGRIDRYTLDKKAVFTLTVKKRVVTTTATPSVGSQNGRTMGNLNRNKKNTIPATTQTSGNNNKTDYEEKLPSKKNNKFKFLIGLIIGLLLGIVTGYALDDWMNKQHQEDEDIKILKEEVRDLTDKNLDHRQKNDSLKQENDRLKQKNESLKHENEDLKKRLETHQSVQPTPKKDPLKEIQSRPDFAEFMELVNHREWEEIKIHQIYTALLENKLREYTYKIEFFCKPKNLFRQADELKLNKEPNKRQSNKLIDWQQNTTATDLKDVHKKVEKLLKDLKNLN